MNDILINLLIFAVGQAISFVVYNINLQKKLSTMEEKFKSLDITQTENKTKIEILISKNHELDSELKITKSEFNFIRENILEIKNTLKELINKK